MGSIVWQQQSTAFGETTITQQSISNHLRFAGQYFDSETNTNYNYHRQYNPATGGYTQTDPIGLAGGLNRQGYVNQNPVNLIDPSGLTIYGGPAGSGQYSDFPPPKGCRQATTAGEYIVGWKDCDPPGPKPPPAEPPCPPKKDGWGTPPNGNGFPQGWGQPSPKKDPAPPKTSPSPKKGGLGVGYGGTTGLFLPLPLPVGCVMSGSVGANSTGVNGAAYSGCGVGVGDIFGSRSWQAEYGFGDATGRGANLTLGGGFGFIGSVDIFITSTGANIGVGVGSGEGAIGGLTLGKRVEGGL